jgi:hypothetical protein
MGIEGFFLGEGGEEGAAFCAVVGAPPGSPLQVGDRVVKIGDVDISRDINVAAVLAQLKWKDGLSVCLQRRSSSSASEWDTLEMVMGDAHEWDAVQLRSTAGVGSRLLHMLRTMLLAGDGDNDGGDDGDDDATNDSQEIFEETLAQRCINMRWTNDVRGEMMVELRWFAIFLCLYTVMCLWRTGDNQTTLYLEQGIKSAFIEAPFSFESSPSPAYEDIGSAEEFYEFAKGPLLEALYSTTVDDDEDGDIALAADGFGGGGAGGVGGGAPGTAGAGRAPLSAAASPFPFGHMIGHPVLRQRRTRSDSCVLKYDAVQLHARAGGSSRTAPGSSCGGGCGKVPLRLLSDDWGLPSALVNGGVELVARALQVEMCWNIPTDGLLCTGIFFLTDYFALEYSY